MVKRRIDISDLSNRDEVDWQQSATRLGSLASATTRRSIEFTAVVDPDGAVYLDDGAATSGPSHPGEDADVQRLVADLEAWVVRVREGQPSRQIVQNPDGSPGRTFVLVPSVTYARDVPEQWSTEAYEIVTHEDGTVERVSLDLGRGDRFGSMFDSNITVGQRLNEYLISRGLYR